MLHVTNGDAAADAIRAAGIPGEILPWRDVLHEGPVPADLALRELSLVRAEFIASRGWGGVDEVRREFEERDGALAASVDEDEVVLWFEHDLFDQLQLIQVLDWFAAHPRPGLTLINPAQYLGPSTPDELRALFALRMPVTRAHLSAARAAWEAFRAPDPRGIEAIPGAELAALPHLASALRRHLQQFPSTRDGLSRSERQALEVLAEGPRPAGELYVASHHDREDPIWLGDSTFYSYLEDLGPLVTIGGATEIHRRIVTLTELGRDVLAGRADRVAAIGIDRWLGGVHLSGVEVPWRWDEVAGHIAKAS
ncbi:DUF1835 domain-containing protein [Longimicrobium sp.]|jgi:hypothetical protein|uniref:DUF1835 domain-containing protein n=1 Tax=Longimicrobium sp. TaxID=2029185 RepID=UPI002F94F928